MGEWLEGIAADEPLFPKLAKRRTWLMVKKDLERIGVPYETADGIADFHAAGRHSHITELLRSGVSLPEARELARHSDIRMTMKYTHIGLDDQARAVNQLPAPPKVNPQSADKCLHIVCTDGGAGGQDGATADSDWQDSDPEKKSRNPSGEKGFGSKSQPTAPHGNSRQKMEAAGIEPASCEPLVEVSTCVDCRLGLALSGTANRAAVRPGHDLSRLGRSDR